MHAVIDWLVNTIGAMGYPGIFLLMAIESSAFPFPSEVVMIPAGYLVHKGQMNMVFAVLSGAAGSLVGAYTNYYAARYLGRPLILKYGRFILLTEEKFAKAEAFFRNHGEISTFVGRLLPGIRQLISLPAGLAGMNHLHFTFYTLCGAGAWITVLAWIGYLAGAREDLVRQYAHQAVVAAIVFSVFAVALYIWRYRRRKRAAAETGTPTGGRA